MRQTQSQIEATDSDMALLDRVEDAVSSVNPDLWLGALLLAVLASWLGRII